MNHFLKAISLPLSRRRNTYKQSLSNVRGYVIWPRADISTEIDGFLLISYPLKRGVIIRERCVSSSDKNKFFDSVLDISTPK